MKKMLVYTLYTLVSTVFLANLRAAEPTPDNATAFVSNYSIPRRSSDVVQALGSKKMDAAELRWLQQVAVDPDSATEVRQWTYWRKKALSFRKIGDSQSAKRAYDRAVSLSSGAPVNQTRALLREAALYAASIGEYQAAIQIAELAVKLTQNSIGNLETLARIQAEVGDIDKAIDSANSTIRMLFRSDPNGSDPPNIYREPTVRYIALEGQGKWREAEQFIRKSIDAYDNDAHNDQIPFWIEDRKLHLARNLTQQKRYGEAEQIVREIILRLAQSGEASQLMTAEATLQYAELLQELRRYEESENLIGAVNKMLNQLGTPRSSKVGISVLSTQARTFLAKGQIQEALLNYREIQALTQENQYLRQIHVLQSADAMLVFSLDAKNNRASPDVERFVESRRRNYGTRSLGAAEAQAILAVAYWEEGDAAKATIAFEAAFGNTDIHRIPHHRLQLITEEYLQLIKVQYDRAESPVQTQRFAERALQVAELGKEGQLIKAMAAASARTMAKDPETAALIREQQDLEQSLETLALHLARIDALPATQDAVRMATRISSIQLEKNTALANTKAALSRRIGRLETLTEFSYVNVQALKKSLHDKEVVIEFFIGNQASFTWAINSYGMAFYQVDLSRQLASTVISDIRRAIDLNSVTDWRNLPQFNLVNANMLFAKLLAPSQSVWGGASQLIFIQDANLSSIPMGLLPMNLPTNGLEALGNVDWLGLRYAISTTPSLNAWIGLRTLPIFSSSVVPFIGFGNPIFQVTELAMSLTSTGTAKARSVRALVTGQSLRESRLGSANISMLAPLPETEDEILSVAKLLGGSGDDQIYLGNRATEGNVKSASLDKAGVVMFATHGLLAGDLDGLNQPALALSNPQAVSDSNDGLLTLEEILALRMNANWVILSACNTAGNDGQSSEALSGLGRAFFYAGTRSILATHWSVESDSAQWLTKGIFTEIARSPGISKSEALRRSMNNIAKREGQIGGLPFSHPAFWAPFEIAGDSR